jgi:hypothetical protein
MKNTFFLAIMLFTITASANISKVFVCNEGEVLGSTPIHGTTAWSTYIGTSKLAFARGYTYIIGIEHSGLLPPGTIGISNASGVISSIQQSGNKFIFKLTIPMVTDRLTTFQIGYKKTATSITYPIACEVVNIGKLYSMTLQDSTNTTMATFATKSTALVALQFAKQTGKKYFRFYGSDLGNARFNHTTLAGQAMGLLFGSNSFSLVDNTNFKLTATTGSVSTTGGKFAEHILGRVIDSAADKHYSWVTYRYARKMEGEIVNGVGGPGTTSTETNTTDPLQITAAVTWFSVLPGQVVQLPAATSGFHDFLSASYSVN